MQVLQAGEQKLLLLELELDKVGDLARQIGFEVRTKERERALTLDLTAQGRKVPLLLFDASDPANLGWFSRCQFYVDGKSGGVLQTPISIGNMFDRSGHALPFAVRVQIAKELPTRFRLPGKQPVSEQLVYTVLANLLNALLNVGVGVCGQGAVKSLAGRSEFTGERN